MPNFFLPRGQIVDVNGRPQVGAKLYFYLTATSTPHNVYQDEARTTPHANPVEANSSGIFPTIWMDPGIQYKVVLKTLVGVTIYTEDPVRSVVLDVVSTSSINKKLADIASTPLDYGAVGDGVNDESAAVQSAINNATYTVDLLGKTYRCDSQLTHPGNKKIINGTLDFFHCSNNVYFTQAGGGLAAAINLTANATKGQKTLTLASTSTLASGVIIWLTDTSSWSAAGVQGEMCRIRSVDSSTVVTLSKKIQGSYATADTAKVEAVIRIGGIVMERVTINGDGGTSRQAMKFEFCDGVSLDRCTATAVACGVEMLTCIRSRIVRTSFTEMDGTSGVGILLSRNCEDIVLEQIRVTQCAEGILVGGPSFAGTQKGVCRYIHADRIDIQGCDNRGISILPGAEHISVSHSEIVCSNGGALQHGMHIQGRRTRVDHVNIYCPDKAGVVIEPLISKFYTSHDEQFISVDHITIINPGDDGIRIVSQSIVDCRNLSVEDNSIVDAGGYGITLNATANDAGEIHITGNQIIGSALSGIYCVNATGYGMSHIDISGNTIQSPTSQDGIKVIGVSTDRARYITIDKNRISNVTGSGINCDYILSTSMTGNNIDGSGSFGMYLTNIESVAINGGSISGASIGIAIESLALNCDDFNISGTVVNSTGNNHGIYIYAPTGRTVTRFAIGGCNVTVTDTATYDCIRLQGTDATSITGANIQGNVLYKGKYGVEGTNVASSQASDNRCASQGTGATTGITASNNF